MPRVYVKTARRDYPEDGIKRGQKYWTWAFYRQRARRSPKPPTRSQLTQVEYRQMVYSVYDQSRDWGSMTRGDIEDAVSQLDEASSLAQDTYDNIPESLQMGEQGMRLEEIMSNIDQASSDLSGLADEMEDEDFDMDSLESRFMETEPDVDA